MRTPETSLKLHRKLRGLSQGDIAEITGVTFQQVQKWEDRKNRIHADTLGKILEAWNMSYATFMGIEEVVEKEEIEIEHLRWWKALSPERKLWHMNVEKACEKTERQLKKQLIKL